jgi:cytoplasmic iron level regulating protein YaaA (DUF328/UPF0246 family)
MRIIFLLPPSEWKNWENKFNLEKLSFNFEKPLDIAENVSEKDLKCSWKRFEEGVELNKNLSREYRPAFLTAQNAIKRYSWVMFKAIDYENMNNSWKKFFEENFLILSWMYWIVKPLDLIWNYKLPIDTKWLLDFWWEKIAEKIVELKPDFIVNLLPISYSKMLWLAKCRKHIYKRKILIDSEIKIININFLKEDWSKISHWVKKIKWEWIKNICEKNIVDYKDFGWKIVKLDENNIDINIIK